MRRLLVALCSLTACLTEDLQKTRLLFNEYKQEYQKTYSSDENEYRLQVFSKNFDFINRHNEEADRGLHTYRCGVNKFTDMSPEEFGIMLGFRYNASATYNKELYVPQISDQELPAEIDWRLKGYVTPVKFQGSSCGSCWAFSATGSLEGQHYNRTKQLVSLSEQNLVDCSKDGNNGCGGGFPDLAFKYIKKNHGIDTEKSYPYKAEDGKKCLFKKGDVGATLKSWRDVPTGSEKALQKAVAEVGPISVCIDASQNSFQFYSSGVYYEPACSSSVDQLDHAVLVVGYGVEQSQDYWLIKNSWDVYWGEQGYMKLARNRNNQCGIATAASYPVV